MLRIALCDDEGSARDTLRIQLEKILKEEEEEIVYEFSSGVNAYNWLKKHPGEIDLLFLDVEMPHMSGMETAREIRTFNESIMIVFVTGYSDYVFDGYSIGALDYIMKPARGEQLMRLMERVHKIMGQNEGETFILKNTEGTYRFRQDEILYFYSERRKVVLVTGEGEFSFYEKLDCVMQSLKANFVRIHQRYLVNAKKVTYIGSSEIEIEQIMLPMSRAYKEEATTQLAKAMLGGL